MRYSRRLLFGVLIPMLFAVAMEKGFAVEWGDYMDKDKLLYLSVADGYGFRYELAESMLANGADMNKVMDDGTTALQTLLSHRINGRRSEQSDSLIMCILFVKYMEQLPEPTADFNLFETIVEGMEQPLWDLLSIKFSEEQLFRATGRSTQPAAHMDGALGRRLAVPAPKGFVLTDAAAPAGLRHLASESKLDPDQCLFFVPENEDPDTPKKMTTAAAFIRRQDIVGLSNENDALLRAMSMHDSIRGRFFSMSFLRNSITIASPDMVPWRIANPKGRANLIVSSHTALAPNEPYQLVFFQSFPDDDSLNKSPLTKWAREAVLWGLAIRYANE